jgi:methionyl-tRNA formyltransferase
MKRFALDSDITSDELFHELSHVGVEAVHEAISAIKNGIKPIAQPTVGATRALKLSKEEGRIDWSQSADAISQKIRAFTSNPGAWTLFRGLPIKLESPRTSTQTLPSGDVRSEREYVLVGTSTTALEIHTLIPSGKNRMSASSWLNGVRLQSGETFG